MTDPDVSVVMSVFNGAETLAETLESVLSQEGVALELVVVNDGSTDASGSILDDYARRDARVRVIHQENTGLTRALIRGCATARGRYIARQDAGGDVSLPGRLKRQLAILDQDPAISMTSCGTRFVGPAGELLYEVRQQGEELQRVLGQTTPSGLRGPSHHGSTLFRRALYEAVGGYRPEFRVAQDLDLWTRLAEQGRCVATREVLYQAVWALDSISHLRRRHQEVATKAVFECRERRRRGESEQPVLERLGREFAQPSGGRTPRGLSKARFDYFLGSLLATRDPAAARRYLRQAVAAWPWHLKAWVKLARLALRSPR